MSELHRALAEIKHIRCQVARDTQFRGYGPASVAASGVLALLVAALQSHWLRNEMDFRTFAAVWIATTPDFAFSGIKDLKGQTVVTGQMPTTSTSLFLKLLKENGLDGTSDVSLIQVPIGSEIGPFLNGQGKIAVLYEPGLDQAVAKGMKVVLGFPKLYGAYEFSAIAARKDIDPALAQKMANGLEAALRFIHSDAAGTIAIAKQEFPTLDPAVVEAAVQRMIGENVYPASVEITPAALKLGLETQIALGNLAAQPAFDDFVATRYFAQATAAK